MIRILVIGGDNHDRRFLSDLLYARGMAVVFASSGDEALESANANVPAMALCELLMPSGDGELLIRRWKTDPLLGRVPFVVLANAGVKAEDERIALELGADGFLARPIQSGELASRIDAILADARAGSIRQPVDADLGHLLRLQDALVRRLRETLADVDTLGDALERRSVEHDMLEAELRETKKRLRLESQSQSQVAHSGGAAGTLAAALAHDLKNTLGVVLGNVELAELDRTISASVRKSLEEIRKAGARGNEIVQQILTFGRQGNGKPPHGSTEPMPALKAAAATSAASYASAASSAASQSPAPPRGDGRHILYVDDEEPLVELAVRMLTRIGYRVSGFALPEQALAKLRDDPSAFDIVVTDFHMPHITGLDVAKEATSLRPDLPVMVTSGYITEDMRQKATAAGARFLVEKPDTVDGICAAVHGALSTR
jgi:CheY-like chemotaxis protein